MTDDRRPTTPPGAGTECRGTKETRPLAGVRVVDFAWVWVGGTLSHLLSDFGAEVIKVESRRRVDLNRRAGPFSTGAPDIEAGVSFHSMHRNSLSVALDLGRPEAVDIVKELVAVSDVVVENFAPRFLPSRGLGYADLVKVRPDLIMVSISAAGQDGPCRDIVTYGPAIGALAGMEALTGYPGERPMGSQLALTDPASGTLAAFAVFVALRHRRRTGAGQHIDLSQWEAATALMGYPLMDYFFNRRSAVALGNRHRWAAPHGVYRCAGEDRWIAIACMTEDHWHALVRAMGSPEWASAPEFGDIGARWAHQEALDQRIEAWTVGFDHYDLMERLQAAGVPAQASLDTQELIADPHSAARATFTRLDHPKSPGGLIYGVPWKLSRTPGEIRTPAPLLGQHNGYVLGELLGYGEAGVAALAARGIAQ